MTEILKPEEGIPISRTIVLVSNCFNKKQLAGILQTHGIETEIIGGRKKDRFFSQDIHCQQHFDWVRDCFTQIGKILFFPTEPDQFFMKQVLSNLGLDSQFTFNIDPIGEGGHLRICNKEVLISTMLGSIRPPTAQAIENQGFRIVRIPMDKHLPDNQVKDQTRVPLNGKTRDNAHIDRFLALVRGKNGNQVLFVDPIYQQAFHSHRPPTDSIESIAKQNGWQIYILSDEEAVTITANMMQLKSGEVLISGASASTLDFIRQILEQRIILIPPQLVADPSFSGGLNCRLNTITI